MKIVVNKYIPFKGYKAMNVFGILFCRKDCQIDEETINHECIHTAQMKEMLYIPFYIWYGFEWFFKLFVYWDSHKAYRAIGFEREAYRYEGAFEYLKNRRHFEWFKHIVSK